MEPISALDVGHDRRKRLHERLDVAFVEDQGRTDLEGLTGLAAV
jgi:hypothetical protein